MNRENMIFGKLNEILFPKFKDKKQFKKFSTNFLKNSSLITELSELKPEDIKIEEREIFIELKGEKLIEFYFMTEEYLENVLFAYRINSESKNNIIYGIIVKNNNVLIDTFCMPHFSMEYSIKSYQGKLYSLTTGEETGFNGILKSKIKHNLPEDKFERLINEMLKKEKLLVKNTITRVF